MAIRDIACELLLRDIETLLDKYLIKTRKVSIIEQNEIAVIEVVMFLCVSAEL